MIMTDIRINSTLCYIEKNGCYLMLFRNKKKQDPCEGKWVGVGGKFEIGESAQDCVLREVKEETGLLLTDYHFCGIVHFVSDTWPDEDMYLYTAKAFEGNDAFPFFSPSCLQQETLNGIGQIPSVFDCDEGELCWIPKDQILQLNLWEGDKFFLEPLIAGEDQLEMTCRYEGHRCVEVIRQEKNGDNHQSEHKTSKDGGIK